MYTLYKFHFLNGISEINQLFDDILIIWPAPVYIWMYHLQLKSIDLYLYLKFILMHIDVLLLFYLLCKAPWEATFKLYFIIFLLYC